MRTIKVSFDAMSWTAFCRATDPAKADAALGYLAAYNPIYHHVHISHGRTCMTAFYRVDPSDAKAGFVIGAIWHPDTETFSFHS